MRIKKRTLLSRTCLAARLVTVEDLSRSKTCHVLRGSGWERVGGAKGPWAAKTGKSSVSVKNCKEKLIFFWREQKNRILAGSRLKKLLVFLSF